MLTIRGMTSVIAKRHLVTVAANANTFKIPVIDFSKFKNDKSLGGRQQTAEEVVTALKGSGFIYLENHGISSDMIRITFQKSAEFFKLPSEVKSTLAWEDPRSNRGYVKVGRERVTQSRVPDEIMALRARAPDFKESMEIGRDWDSERKNMWPREADVPSFKQTMLNFFQTCHNLHVDVMRSIALGLGLGEHFFDDKINDQCHNLRLLSYPPVKRTILEGEGQARAGAHSDYGMLTLLFQDSVGGLEVKNPHTGTFIPAKPIEGTIVVNVGDLLARWSNDVLRSTLHRVSLPSAKQINAEETLTPVRQSIAFFCNPNFSAKIACLPNCGDKPKYPPVNTGEYIIGRLADTFI